MEIGSEFFSPTKIIELPAGPTPKLLLELEPVPRVFFENLLDIILLRSPAPVPTTSRPGRFWNDVFVPTAMPWWGFGESMLWHMLFVAALWSLSQGIALHNPALLRPNPRRSYISYYRPSPTFPVAGSRPATARENARARAKAPEQSPLRVSREGKPGLVVPPDLKLGQPGQPDIPGSGGALPAMPFSATARSKFNVPAAPGSAVGPPPEMPAAAGRRGGLPAVSVVAPPPEVAAISSRRGLGAPGARVVEPPPSVKGALRKLGDVNIAHAEVVAPAPRLPMHEQRAGIGVDQGGLGGSSSAVVPPPPSVERSGTLSGGRSGSMAGTGMQVVPPPPSIQEANGGTGAVRVGSLSSDGVQVVPPPPSVEGIGNASGRGRGNGVADNGLGVVPPAPSTRNLSSSARGGRRGSLSGTGLQVVPPPPSVQGVGGGDSGGNGRGTALAGNGLGVVPPAPSGRGIGGSVGGGRGGALGGMGLQASGPSGSGGQGSGKESAGSPEGMPNGTSASPGGSSQIASAGVPGGGTGTGASGGSAAGGDGGGSASGRGHGGGGAGGGNGTGAGPGGGTGGGGASAAGGAGSGTGGSGVGSSAGSPNGSPSGTNPDGVNIAAGGRPFAADIPRARPPILDNPPGPQDLPVRVIGLAMSLPSSSYFSNYEVFIAERRVSKDESQLIKLVYQSLPYQRRLSEYGLNNRVFKLRVTRDPSCDESLIQMTWPDADQPKPHSERSGDSPQLKTGHDDKLPCYRTTADDYRKALAHGR